MSNTHSITLTVKQLREALEFVSADENDEDQFETEITLTQRGEFTSTEGDDMPAGLYVHLTEYPQEGVHGPLGVDMPQST